MMARLFGRALLAGLLAVSAGQAAAVEWKVSLWGDRRASTEHVHKLAELVSERTDGEFTMSIDYGGLSKSTENLDGIAIGAFEMAQVCAGYHVDKNPTLTVLELPFLGVSSLEEEIEVSRAIYDHPATQKDMARWKAMLLMPSPSPPDNLAGVGEPPATVEAFKGKRVRALGGPAEAFNAVGSVPTPITSTEAYEALEKGVVDMVSFAPHAHLAFHTLDLADWWMADLNPGRVNCPVAVSIEAYDALVPEHRRILDGTVEEALDYYVENYDQLLEGWQATLNDKAVRLVTFPATERLRFEKATAPVWDKWLERMEAQGIPGQELYDLVQRTLRESSVAE